jgi:hypothetical protein
MPKGTILTETGSSFKEISALKGSVLYCDSCIATFTKSNFLDVLANDGGSIYLLDGVNVMLNGVKLFNGKAIGGNGGAIYASISDPAIPMIGKLKFLNCGTMN